MSSFEAFPSALHDRHLGEVSCEMAAHRARRGDPISQRKRTSIRPVWLCILALAVAAFGCGALHAQAAAAPDRELVVATKQAPPFAIKQPDGSWSGMSIALWKRIADQAHLRFRLVETQSVPDLLDGVANGRFDVGVAAVTVTAERARKVDFTQPFYNTGLGVAVPVNENPWVAIGRALLSFGFFQAVAVLLGFAMAVGFLIWMLERRKTEHFGGGAKGLGSSFWWSTIAMTQAGAAQNAPTTLPGRIVAMGWMIASVIAIAVFTAGITSTLTRRGLEGAVHGFNDLRSVRVGAVANSATTDYLARQRLSFRTFPDIQGGLSALGRGTIDAFVHDKPLLTWMVRSDFSASARVVDTSFSSESYAIVLPKDSALRPMLDLAVLDQIEGDWWQQTVFETLGNAQSR
ncbi:MULTISPECIES: transporter substrate-binding domain-containing protein [Bradyrhizobium]|uniref:Transporter substrate-binding domain-containing protein n=1 Tax=Bradyrhizobium brasilense TaxID=1419277 RepID=A0ABY8JM59_9BRAD|nr:MULTISPECIES: transporter substrate-binding domain-containing protein [Bradyrhizobium]WFU65476.1 transporter substrate-binding domain-containing protein [Bradyrhizobium brasilense]